MDDQGEKLRNKRLRFAARLNKMTDQELAQEAVSLQGQNDQEAIWMAQMAKRHIELRKEDVAEGRFIPRPGIKKVAASTAGSSAKTTASRPKVAKSSEEMGFWEAVGELAAWLGSLRKPRAKKPKKERPPEEGSEEQKEKRYKTGRESA